MRRLLAAAVIGASLFAATPAEALGGTGEDEPTYENLVDDSYNFNRKIQLKISNTPGWVLLAAHTEIPETRMAKLFDCRSNVCIFFVRTVEDPDQNVFVHKINCADRTYEYRNSLMGGWWGTGPIEHEEEVVAFNKFC